MPTRDADAFPQLELLRGVLVITRISSEGEFLPFENDGVAALERKLKAVEEASPAIHTVVLAEKQTAFPEGWPGQAGHDWPFVIIRARNYEDLADKLLKHGGAMGQRLRSRAREDASTLRLFGNREAKWSRLDTSGNTLIECITGDLV